MSLASYLPVSKNPRKIDILAEEVAPVLQLDPLMINLAHLVTNIAELHLKALRMKFQLEVATRTRNGAKGFLAVHVVQLAQFPVMESKALSAPN